MSYGILNIRNNKILVAEVIVKKLLAIGCVAILLCAISAGTVACAKVKLAFDMFYSSWQNDIKDDIKVKDLVIPGSHDAGTKGMIAFAQTQDTTILEQLQAGVRYFDIRVSRKKNNDLVVFHDIINGMNFDSVISDIKTFIAANPDQILILDFQHFKNNAEPLVAQKLTDELNIAEKALPNNTDISQVTMGDMRRANYNYIITWGSGELEANYYKTIYPRKVALSSPYDGEEHKSTPEALIEYFDNYYDGYDGSTYSCCNRN